jgi:hypothetical protein
LIEEAMVGAAAGVPAKVESVQRREAAVASRNRFMTAQSSFTLV